MESFSSALDLANYLKGIFETKGDVNNEEVRQLLSMYSSELRNEADWKQYCFPNDIHYTRNLIFGNEKFELMVLVWQASQETRIHNHSASRCWMTTLSGEISESVYTINPTDKPLEPSECPELTLQETSSHKIGDCGFIEDDIGLHKIGNISHIANAITLHLYSPPIRELMLYEPEKKLISTRRPGFYSIGGKKT